MTEEVATPEQTTLHDTLVASFDEHVPTEATNAEPAAVPAAAPGTQTPAAETPADGRPRDDKGKFVEKPKDAPTAKPAAATATPAGAPAVPPVARPSSWKKDLEPQWQALAPDVQKYILQREGEFAKGVSTYKTEFDQLKPLGDALRPFVPHLQQAGIDPAKFVGDLSHAHFALVRGTPEQKLSMFLKLANDYQVPVAQLFAQGADGKVYFNPQVQPYQPQAQQAAQQQPDVRATVQQVLMQERAQQSLAEFEAQAAEKYPHYETVKADMALLLETGKAQTYEGAYKMALRLDDKLWQSEQESQTKAAEAERQRQAAEAAQRARRQTVSPRSATPASTAVKSGKKDLRSTLEDAFEEHAGAGRV